MLAMTAMLGMLVAADPVAPIIGRPLDFSGAIGGPFKVTMKAEPASVAVEEPFTLSLQIEGPGNLKSIERPALGTLAAFAPFAVENIGDSYSDGPPGRRTFLYRLRARRIDITQVPKIAFVYFNPATVAVNRGFQTAVAAHVPIQVHPQPAATLPSGDGLAKRVSDLRRGLLADPHSQHLNAELESARSEVAYPESDMRPNTSLWPYWLTLTSLGVVVAGVGCVFGGIALNRWRISRSPVWLLGVALGLSIAAVPAVGSLLEWRERSRDESAPVIVLKANTELRRGNGQDYSTRLEQSLPAGAEVRQLFERGNWLQVQLANGVVGWVPRENVIAE